jgi:hypothetical protein
MLIPSGTKVIGHVTQAQARSKGDPQSSLAIVFDKFEVAKDEDIPRVLLFVGGGANNHNLLQEGRLL